MEVRLFVLGLESNPCLSTGPEPNMVQGRQVRTLEPSDYLAMRQALSLPTEVLV